MRFRYWFMIIGSLLIGGALFLSDPGRGSDTLLLLLKVIAPLLAVGLAHLARRGLFDYINLEEAWKDTKHNPVARSIYSLGVCIVIYGLLGLFGKAFGTELPPNAKVYAPVLKAEQIRYWPDHQAPELLAGLAEQESCVSLKNPKCWSPLAKLKTDREEGAGVLQITRAYRADGSLRFDSLADMRKTYPDLRDWTWENVYSRPELQFKALVLLTKENFNRFRDVPGLPRYALADAGYNGGPTNVSFERRACKATPGCDPSIWFGHVELHCLKSKAALYGNRSACDINRTHVQNVMLVRSAKYRQAMA